MPTARPHRRPDPEQLPTTYRLPDRYLTPDDIAELFGISVETVYQWRRKRTGPPGFRIGKHLRFDPEKVARWIEERTNVEGAA